MWYIHVRSTNNLRGKDMSINEDMIFGKEIIACMPSLKAFAISICGNVTRADDLVQETMLRALANQASFQPGTNLQAWLFTILRNHFRSEYRKRRREVEDSDGHHAGSLKQQPSQEKHLEFEDFKEALETLPVEQKEALVLVGASGFSYDEAASILECAVGTTKSRVNRARTHLGKKLSVDLRELNKKNWKDEDGFSVPKKSKPPRGKSILALPEYDDFFRPPEQPSPVRYISKEAVEKLYIEIAPSTDSRAEKTPDVVIEGIGFILERVEALANGTSRSYYRAL
jgi:RNA polymerase sigma-70 factor (ECF subfamily)